MNQIKGKSERTVFGTTEIKLKEKKSLCNITKKSETGCEED